MERILLLNFESNPKNFHDVGLMSVKRGGHANGSSIDNKTTISDVTFYTLTLKNVPTCV